MIHRHRGGIEGMFGQRRVVRRVGQPSATFGLPCTAVALLILYRRTRASHPLAGQTQATGPSCPFSSLITETQAF